MARLSFFWFSAFLTVACATGSTSQPLAAIDEYADALHGNDYGRAYNLMSERYRREHSREDFIRMMKESPEEARVTASKLKVGRRRVEVEARFRYNDLGDELMLVLERGEWKISNDPVNFYPQDTPQNALRSFIRAHDNKRWEIVMRLIPNRWREEMTVEKVRDHFEGKRKEEVQQMMRLLRANQENTIEQQGDSARMQYGEKYEVRFVKEEGVWKIDDPD